jgi:hypothetical protein
LVALYPARSVAVPTPCENRKLKICQRSRDRQKMEWNEEMRAVFSGRAGWPSVGGDKTNLSPLSCFRFTQGTQKVPRRARSIQSFEQKVRRITQKTLFVCGAPRQDTPLFIPLLIFC